MSNWEIFVPIAVCSILSMIGSAFICLMYLKFSNLQVFPYKLVFLLGLSDLLTSLVLCFPTDISDNDIFCQAQASVLSFSSVSSVLWTGCISHAIHTIFATEVTIEGSGRLVKMYMAFNYGFSLVLAILPLPLGYYGQSGPWCWISVANTKHEYLSKDLLAFITYYVPCLIVISFNVFVTYRIRKKLRSHHFISATRSFIMKKILLFPTVMIFCFAPLMMLRLLQIFDFGNEGVLEFTGAIIFSLWGLFNSLIYGVTANVKETLLNWYRNKHERDSTPLDLLGDSQV